MLGLSIYKDYGLAWDERAQQHDNGELNYNYAFHGDSTIINTKERYHGPAFELTLVSGEKLLKLEDTRDIYLFRHLVSFLVFFVGCIFFFLLADELLKQRWLALLSVGLLVLSPRIFADSFYNSKDIPFLSFFVISVYTQIRFLKKPSLWRAFFHALACGFLIDIRISGIVLPTVTVFLYMILPLWRKDFRQMVKGRFWLYLLFYGFILAAVVYTFWPVLWKQPFYRFHAAYEEMSHYPWMDTILYWGQQVFAPNLPWHYAPVWMLITIPPVYTLLFVTGVLLMFWKFIRGPIAFMRREPVLLLCAFYFFFPLFMVIFLHSVVYDGWRHLYFIYPFFLLVAAWGLKNILQITQNMAGKIMKFSFILLLAAQVIVVLNFMIKYHPNQQLYFSELVKQDAGSIHRWELDYWGPSFRTGLEYILKHDNRPQIVIAVDNFPGKENLDILTPSQRNRFILVEEPEKADYFIANFRWRWDYYPYPEWYALNVRGMKPLVVYKMKPGNTK